MMKKTGTERQSYEVAAEKGLVKLLTVKNTHKRLKQSAVDSENHQL